MDDLKLFTRDEDTGALSLTPPSPPQKVSGLDKLVQAVFLAILNDPGRNVFTPQEGSGLPSLIGSNISVEDSSEVIAEVSEKIDKIEEELLDAQTGLENEEPSERLRELSVISVESGINIDEILLKFKIVSEAGDETYIAI